MSTKTQSKVTPTLSDKVIAEIELVYDQYSDLPDGAWWAVCAEHGLDPEDFVAYWEMKNAQAEARP